MEISSEKTKAIVSPMVLFVIIDYTAVFVSRSVLTMGET